METRSAPGLYLDPPTFDIELEEFGTLPMCRLEAIRLLREGRTVADDQADGSRKALTAGKPPAQVRCATVTDVVSYHTSSEFAWQYRHVRSLLKKDEPIVNCVCVIDYARKEEGSVHSLTP